MYEGLILFPGFYYWNHLWFITNKLGVRLVYKVMPLPRYCYHKIIEKLATYSIKMKKLKKYYQKREVSYEEQLVISKRKIILKDGRTFVVYGEPLYDPRFLATGD